MNNGMNIPSMGWSMIIDLNNKLVIYVAVNVIKVEVDPDTTKCDPDGVPLVWVEGKHVTRVRRMTDEEFQKYVTQYGMKFEVDMRAHYAAEKDVPNKEEGDV